MDKYRNAINGLAFKRVISSNICMINFTLQLVNHSWYLQMKN